MESKLRRDLISYFLIAIWVTVMFVVKSMIWKEGIAVLLISISFFSDYLYYKSLNSAIDKKQYISRKILLAISVIAASIIIWFAFYNK